MTENREWYDYLDWSKGINERNLYGEREEDDEDDEYDEADDSDDDDEDDWLIGE